MSSGGDRCRRQQSESHPRFLQLDGRGAYDNDENTLIVHDRALAQAYYEEWRRLWGTLDPDRICNPMVRSCR